MGLIRCLVHCAQYEFHNVLELIKAGHPDPTRKVRSIPCTGLAEKITPVPVRAPPPYEEGVCTSLVGAAAVP